MDYYVYADGAFSSERGVGSWSYLVFTDIRFLNWESGKSMFITSPTYAEDIAVGMACYYLLTKILTKKDRIIIHSDSLSTIKLITNVLDKNYNFKSNDTLVQDAVESIKKLSEKTRVELCKVHSHKNTLNPNICVDRMAKYYLRS